MEGRKRAFAHPATFVATLPEPHPEREDALPTKRVKRCACDKFDTTGKALLIVRNRVKPQNQKYFAFPEVKIMALIRQPGPHEGAFRDRHDALGRGCGGRFGVRHDFFAPDENAEAYGQVVWS